MNTEDKANKMENNADCNNSTTTAEDSTAAPGDILSTTLSTTEAEVKQCYRVTSVPVPAPQQHHSNKADSLNTT